MDGRRDIDEGQVVAACLLLKRQKQKHRIDAAAGSRDRVGASLGAFAELDVTDEAGIGRTSNGLGIGEQASAKEVSVGVDAERGRDVAAQVGRININVDQAGVVGQVVVGRRDFAEPHADGEDDEVADVRRARLRADTQRAVGGFETRHAVAKREVKTAGAEVLGHVPRHVRVQRGHHLRKHLHDGDLEPAMTEVLGHFESDEPAAHDHRARRLSALDPGLYGVDVGDVADGEDPAQGDARHVRDDRRSAGREDQLVVWLLVFAAGSHLLHPDDLALAVNGEGLVQGAHIEAEARLQPALRLHEQIIAVGDHPADEIGQAAVGERDIRAPFEHHDLGALVHAPQPRRAGCASSHPADDQHSFD